MAVPQAQLTEAFQAFNQLAAELSDSYTGLQRRVAELQGELDECRTQQSALEADRETAAREARRQRPGRNFATSCASPKPWPLNNGAV